MIKRKVARKAIGTAVQLAAHVAQREPGLRGFSPQNLWRMRQFFLTYRDNPKLSPLVRQRDGSPDQVFKDAYVVESLNLPEAHSEGDLHRGLLERLKSFLIELGRDFCFVGSEYPVQVGGRDFALDLLFFHRGLNCLVAIELKVDRFEPEHLGKLNFYLEALDRDARKPHENPSIGLLLCASKDSEVVEYALSRSLSPASIAEYQTQLPDKKLLAAKLHEFYASNASEETLLAAKKKMMLKPKKPRRRGRDDDASFKRSKGHSA